MARKKQTKKIKNKLVKKEYTEEEKARIANYKKRYENKPIKFKSMENDLGIPTLEINEHHDLLGETRLFEALGTSDKDLQKYLLEQVVQTFNTESLDEWGDDAVFSANNALAMLAGIQPRDELEGLLAVQMIGVHNMAMNNLAKSINNRRLNGKQIEVALATKMLRTFMAQMEALKKYRTGGEQKMTVEHVHVNEGGQAIVGNVNQGGGKKNNG